MGVGGVRAGDARPHEGVVVPHTPVRRHTATRGCRCAPHTSSLPRHPAAKQRCNRGECGHAPFNVMRFGWRFAGRYFS
eukprot:364464-Chlamydomonas_euryale.AAC.5